MEKTAMKMTMARNTLNSTTKPIHIRPAIFTDLWTLACIDAEAFQDDEYFAWLCPYRAMYPHAFRLFMYRMLIWRTSLPTQRTWIAYTINSAHPSPHEDRVLGYIMAQRLGESDTAYAWYTDSWTKYLIRRFCFVLTSLIHFFRLDPCISHASYLKSTQYSPPAIFPASLDRFHIQQLSVLPAVQRCGVGTKLFAFVKAVADRDTAAVTLESSHVAQAFYRRHGCVDVGKVDLDRDSGLWAAAMAWYPAGEKGGAEAGKKVRWVEGLEGGVEGQG